MSYTLKFEVGCVTLHTRFTVHLQIECSGIVDHAQKIIDANNLGKGMYGNS